MGIGDWRLGIGDWGLGPIPNPQSKFQITMKIIIKKKINYQKIIKMNTNFILDNNYVFYQP
jgi:hypothetical protein